MKNEQLYYDTLKRIAKRYKSVDRLYREADRFGTTGEEQLQMAYENIKDDAAIAIYGKRRPKDKQSPIQKQLPQLPQL